MEVSDLTESILMEMLGKHDPASRSSHLEVFSEKYAAEIFLSITYIFNKFLEKYLLM